MPSHDLELYRGTTRSGSPVRSSPSNYTSQAAFHVGPSWAPVGHSWAPVGPRLGPTGAHLGMLLGLKPAAPSIIYQRPLCRERTMARRKSPASNAGGISSGTAGGDIYHGARRRLHACPFGSKKSPTTFHDCQMHMIKGHGTRLEGGLEELFMQERYEVGILLDSSK